MWFSGATGVIAPNPWSGIPYDSAYAEPTIASADPNSFLIQYGMEYSPVAINEVLAYQFTNKTGTAQRMFVELVNTLVEDNASTQLASSVETSGWDFVVMQDDNLGRPDPYTGQIPAQNGSQTAGPFVQTVFPCWLDGTSATTTKPANQYRHGLAGRWRASPQPAVPILVSVLPSSRTRLTANSDSRCPTAKGVTLTATSPTGSRGLQRCAEQATPGNYYWLYLRRPANPFDAPPYTTTPTPFDPEHPNDNRVVVDCFRFIYTASTATFNTTTNKWNDSPTNSYLFSLQRLQPNRGGQAVPPLNNKRTSPDKIRHDGLRL